MGSSKKAKAVKKQAATKTTAKKTVVKKTVAKKPADAPKVQGPASYFPSIEKTYGKPVAHWFKVLDKVADRKHGEQVTFLKTAHKLGHGHANALVAYHRAARIT